jgi:hypothetical protein
MKNAIAVGAMALAIAVPAAAQPSQQTVTPPRATVYVSGTTHSGFMGTGNPSAGDIMRQMMRGGTGNTRSLLIELGSTMNPAASPRTEQAIPAAMSMGPALPLKLHERPPESEPDRGAYEPRGKLYLYWGCGERAGAGQPIVIDFARVARGEMPAALRNANIPQTDMPSLWRRSWASRASWPNNLSGGGSANVTPTSSLVGAHTVRGPYTPTMNFSVAPSGDFLAPISMTGEVLMPSGAKQLTWAPIANATGFMLGSVGPKGSQVDERNPEMVFWSSSSVQAFMPAVGGYLEPADVRRLIAARVALAPTTTTCTVPKEVVEASSMGMVMMSAYGPVSDFVFPPRPTDPRTPWNQEWSAKVRTNAMWSGFLGQNPMGPMAGGEQAPGTPANCPPPRQRSAAESIGQASGIPGGGAIGRALGGLGRSRQQQPPAQPEPPPGCPR